MTSQVTATLPESRAESLAAIRATFTEIHQQRLAWERDVSELFDDFDSLAIRIAVETTAAERSAPAAPPVEDASRWEELAQRHDSLLNQQRSSTQELSDMRQMIEQQTELLAAFVGAATQWTDLGAPAPKTSKPSGKKQPDPVVQAVEAEFAQFTRPTGSDGRAANHRPGLVKAG